MTRNSVLIAFKVTTLHVLENVRFEKLLEMVSFPESRTPVLAQGFNCTKINTLRTPSRRSQLRDTTWPRITNLPNRFKHNIKP